MENRLNTKSAEHDVIKEEFNITENLPLWLQKMYYKNRFCKIIYHILIFLR